MPARTTKKKTHARKRTKSGLGRAIKEHPVRTAAVAAGAIAGAALLRKAANTAAKVITIKAAAGAAKEVAKTVRGARGKR